MRISDWSSDVCSSDLLITGAAVPEIVPVQYACFLEQADGAVHGGDRNARIDGRGAPVQFLHVRVIGGIAQHLGDDAALFGDAQALFMAKGFDVDLAVHAGSLGRSEEHTSELQSLMRKSYAVFG